MNTYLNTCTSNLRFTFIELVTTEPTTDKLDVIITTSEMTTTLTETLTTTETSTATYVTTLQTTTAILETDAVSTATVLPTARTAADVVSTATVLPTTGTTTDAASTATPEESIATATTLTFEIETVTVPTSSTTMQPKRISISPEEAQTVQSSTTTDALEANKQSIAMSKTPAVSNISSTEPSENNFEIVSKPHPFVSSESTETVETQATAISHSTTLPVTDSEENGEGTAGLELMQSSQSALIKVAAVTDPSTGNMSSVTVVIADSATTSGEQPTSSSSLIGTALSLVLCNP